LNVISFETARVTRIFPLEEFTPPATNHPSILPLIAERYGFTIVPNITTREDMGKNGLVFGMGRFNYGGHQVVVSDFAIYTDGLAAVAQKSEWSEAFLDDVMGWVRREFDFREIVSGMKTLYSSTIVVDFEASPSRLLRQFGHLSNFISDRTVTIMPEKRKLEFSRLDFEVDKKAMTGPAAPPKFTLERRANVSFAQERYFSAAAMATAHHIEVLEEIERIAAAA
jgi:hypothetical protein